MSEEQFNLVKLQLDAAVSALAEIKDLLRVERLQLEKDKPKLEQTINAESEAKLRSVKEEMRKEKKIVDDIRMVLDCDKAALEE